MDAIPNETIQAMYRLPTNVMVRTFVCRFGDFTIAVCSTPQAVVYPLIQKIKKEQEATTVHP
jgi:hypothetical protein